MVSVALALALASTTQDIHHYSILAFSKTAGYRHDSIPDARRAILDIAMDRGWSVSFTEDADAIDSNRLKNYDAVVFISTTGKFLDDKQVKALQGFIHGGGGWVGIHAAADAMYDTPWYGKLVGAFFLIHPAQQEADVKIEDTTEPSMQGLPAIWHRKDEWYDYRTDPRADVHVLASLVQSSYKGSKMGDDHPITWKHEFEGGRAWYTGMGHVKESYTDPLFLHMLAEGITWACGGSHRR
jgi:type 1 glutamine amidotransferase